MRFHRIRIINTGKINEKNSIDHPDHLRARTLCVHEDKNGRALRHETRLDRASVRLLYVAGQDGITAAYVPTLENSSDKPNVTCARYTVTNSAVFDLPDDKGGRSDGVIFAENYWAGYVSELQSYLPGYALISGPSATLLNGLPAVRCKYTATLSGVSYNFDMVICIKERMFAYMLTYTAPSDKAETYSGQFENIISEFVFQTGTLG